MEQIKSVVGRALPILTDDIDTDRIIPARFLRSVTFNGLGGNLFIDERNNPAFPMNDPKYSGAEIIIGGKNFGCGSSREHAPQAIKRAGFKAVLAESFAEIFFGNSLTLGLVCAQINRDTIETLARLASDKELFTICLEEKMVRAGEFSAPFSLPDTALNALLNGTYDLLAELLKNRSETDSVCARLEY